MNRRRIYLDHNASAPLVASAKRAMLDAVETLAIGGNPSSIHGEGRQLRSLIEQARDQVARLVSVRRERIVFTSGGTEADALGIVGLARAARERGAAPVAIASRTEHPAVIGSIARLAADGFEIRWAPVDADGRWQLDELDRLLAGGAAVVALSAVSHELGVLQPVAEVAARARSAGAYVHADAVQAAGRMPLAELVGLVDALAISAHKIGGPAGAGALVVSPSLPMASPWAGGTQERERRPGTENVLGVVGFGAAAATVDEARWASVAALGDTFELGLRGLGARVHGGGAPRIGGTINVGFANVPGDAAVIALDVAGVSASTGAACSSGSLRPSDTLLAMGLDEESARLAIRFSLGITTTQTEIDHVIAMLPLILERIRTAY